MSKPLAIIYFNNFVAYSIYKLFKLLLPTINGEKKGILFMNHGNLGDIIISTSILENEDKFPQGMPLYFLIKSEFASLLNQYSGRFHVISWNYRKYKYSIIYRLKFLLYLRRLNIETCYNLTSARGVTSDDLALLSGAKNIYCINNRWKYLRKLFLQKLNQEYHAVLYPDLQNEYHKHSALFNLITGVKLNYNTDVTNSKLLHGRIVKDEGVCMTEKYIAVAPFASDRIKSVGAKKYKLIIEELVSHLKVMVIGSEAEREESDKNFNSIIGCQNLVGKFSLTEIIKLISYSSLFIGNDSGLTHIAIKYSVPTIAIIGGGSYGMYLPFQPNDRRIFFAEDMDCFGCEWNCIHEKRFCLTEIDVNSIINSAVKMLNSIYVK